MYNKLCTNDLGIFVFMYVIFKDKIGQNMSDRL